MKYAVKKLDDTKFKSHEVIYWECNFPMTPPHVRLLIGGALVKLCFKSDVGSFYKTNIFDRLPVMSTRFSPFKFSFTGFSEAFV